MGYFVDDGRISETTIQYLSVQRNNKVYRRNDNLVDSARAKPTLRWSSKPVVPVFLTIHRNVDLQIAF